MENAIRVSKYKELPNFKLIKDKYNFAENVDYFHLSYSTIIKLHILSNLKSKEKKYMENAIRTAKYKELPNSKLIKDKYSFIESIEYFPLAGDSVYIDIYIKEENYTLLELLGSDFKNKIRDEISAMVKSSMRFSNCSVTFFLMLD